MHAYERIAFDNLLFNMKINRAKEHYKNVLMK